jgi:hypothetical protein
MTVNNSKLNYYSSWQIDQLVTGNPAPRVVVPIGVSFLADVPTDLPDVPEFDVQFQIATFQRWYSPGAYSTNGTLAGMHYFNVYIQNRKLYIDTDIAGTARYFMWADKVDY